MFSYVVRRVAARSKYFCCSVMAASTLGSAWFVTNDGNAINKKPRRLVKHKKRTWRVTEIGDVDRFLESQRLDERLGGPLAERPDENLFVLDTQKESSVVKPQSVLKQRSKDIGPLKCFSILTPSSAVPDPLVKRNRVRTAEERADPLVLKIKQERRDQGKIPRKYVQSIHDRKKSQENYAQKKKSERLRTTFDFDLWGEKGDALVVGDKGVVAADLPDDVKKYTLEKIGKRIYSRPDTISKKTTALPAVEVPHPGASYNPTFQDHQELLQKACLNEAKEIKKEKKVSKAIAPMLKKVSPQEKEKAWMSEMSQGLEDGDGEQDDGVQSTTNLVRSTKPKTMKQKKKAKILKFKEMHRLQLKEIKKRMMALDRLRSIRREIRKEEEEAVKRAEQRKKEKEAKLLKPAVLGRYKYEPLPVEVNLSDDIAGTLRGLKTEGNVLIDRYKSLQRRNIVEPRIRQRTVYKYKHKKFVKRSYSTPQGVRVGHKNINSLLNKK